MNATRFDLITVDVIEPRSEAAWCDQHLGLVVLEDEDDGRWVVVGGRDGRRWLGFQRSTAAEIANRQPSQVMVALPAVRDQPWSTGVAAVQNVCAAVLRVADVVASREFWREALGLTVEANHLVDSPGRTRLILEPATVEAAGSVVHLDPVCERADFGDEARRLAGLGAVAWADAHQEAWGFSQTFTAPDGVIFCLNAY